MRSIALNASELADKLTARAVEGRQVSNIFFVACGGSLVDLYPSRFFIDSESRRLRTGFYTANEFVHATPKSLGERSVVIVCSHGGTTPEAVESARVARARGALAVTLTHNASAEIAGHSDHNILYEWGDESSVQNNPMAIALALSLEILQHAEGYPEYAAFREGIQRIDAIVADACEMVRPRSKTFAQKYRDEKLFYILSSGASFGHAYGFAICSLMEMQRLDAAAIHSGEFFHGPFEVTDGSRNFIVLLNEGRTRALDERVIGFLDRYAEKVEIVDARELGLAALPSAVVDYFNPVLFYSVMCVYREALAEIRNHPLETRRYMGKVDY